MKESYGERRHSSFADGSSAVADCRSYSRTRDQSEVVFHRVSQFLHVNFVLMGDTVLTHDLLVAQHSAAPLVPGVHLPAADRAGEVWVPVQLGGG